MVQLGGSSTEFWLVCPTKVKARKSFLFTEGSPVDENKEHLFDFVVTLHDLFSFMFEDNKDH